MAMAARTSPSSDRVVAKGNAVAPAGSKLIDLARIEATDVAKEPFTFFCATKVLDSGALERIQADFPKIEKPGLYPLDSVTYGPAFARLIEEIRSPELADAVGRKLGVDLKGLPLMITVRGHAQGKDGRIHTDTKEKIATCLLYLNDEWDEGGGRLRMLRDGENLENYAAEIPPSGGTLASFKVGDNSWHGHKPFVGQRRYVMFNWVSSEGALTRQVGRHKLSARLKKVLPFFYRGK